jgi:hypothetical protein
MRRRGYLTVSGSALLGVASISVGLLLLQNATTPSSTPASGADNPDDMIKDIERQRPPAAPAPAPVPSAPAINPSTAPALPSGAAADSATTGTKLVREGTFITARRGRMTRSVTGEMLFTFDGDARGRSEPAMVLMPCMNLQGMERIVERAGESITFTLSGQVFVYRGRNYLLPTLYQVNRRSGAGGAGEVNSAQ